MNLEPVLVHHRSGQWCPGVRTAQNVVAYDMTIVETLQIPDKPTSERCYLLPDEGVQITRPVVFTGPLEGGWYIDLVRVETSSGSRLIVHDLYLDFVILPATPRYEVLDLDELADALTSGVIDTDTCAAVLRNAQRFVDRHLCNFDVGAPQPWPNFPPAAVVELSALPPFLSDGQRTSSA